LVIAEAGAGARPDTGPAKRGVLAALGQSALLLPVLVNNGLEANDRAKYFMSLLQAARSRADAPSASFTTLRTERIAAGVSDSGLDDVVGASTQANGRYLIPHAGRIHRALGAAVADMLAPLAAAPSASAASSGIAAEAERRLHALLDAAPDLSGDLVPGDYISALTSARPGGPDSLHLLVMDAHRELNRLQAEMATDVLHGAAVYGLDDADTPLVTDLSLVTGSRFGEVQSADLG